MNTPRTFVSIGAGNVAIHLCQGLCRKGFLLKQVFSRTKKSALALASIFNAGSTTITAEISEDADFYLVSVSDNALPTVLDGMIITNKLIFHTAGSYGIEVFKGRFNKCGMLYPLQTFSKKSQLDLSVVPFFVDGCNEATVAAISDIAKRLSGQVFRLDEEKRKWIHLAAVFASNFTNHMYVIANDILENENLNVSLLYPLMEETLRKAQSDKPQKGQTGPAIRGDINTIENHLKLLSKNPDLQKIYTFISRNIMEYYTGGQSKKNNNE